MTIEEIKARFKDLGAAIKQADVAHLDAMHEVGKLIAELQTLRGYSVRKSAEDEAKTYLMASGCQYGERYIRACWQMAFKLSDTQRRKVYKYQMSVGDMIALTNMLPERIDRILLDIRDGKLKQQYGKDGRLTYMIRLMEAPGLVGKRREYQARAENTQGLDYIQAKVLWRGELDEDALTDMFTSTLSRFGERAERCWRMALVRAGKVQAVRRAI